MLFFLYTLISNSFSIATLYQNLSNKYGMKSVTIFQKYNFDQEIKILFKSDNIILEFVHII